MKGLLLAALFVLACIGPADAAVRYFVDDASDILKTLVTDDTLTAPTGETAVAKATIETACACSIYLGGTWDGTDYTPPAGITITTAIDPTTDQGSVQAAAHDMLDVFDAALSTIFENRTVWTPENVENAMLGIHWMAINAARVALNSTRTAANRLKFLDEAASWPTGVNGDPPQYVDAMATTVQVSKDFSWVNPETDPPARLNVGAAVMTGFTMATNVEDAPPTADLIGRKWIDAIP